MTMKKHFSRLAVALLLLLLAAPAAFAAQSKPNIVIIIADDLGWGDVGYHGAKDIKTPNIDRLATEGTRLESFYSQPMCTPSRAAFLTGRYPMRYGLQSFVITPGQHYGLPTDERTIAQDLKQLGYRTYAVGKWHLGHSDEAFWPQNRGFDYFYGTTIGNVDYYTKETSGVSDWQRNGEYLDEKEYFTELITRDAVRIIEEQSGDEPFFLYMAQLAVHSPYQAPQEYLDRYKDIKDPIRRAYAAMAAALDDSVERVMEALEKKGLRENTLVLFMSDNGGIAGSGYSGTMKQVTGDKPAPADNGPFRGSKASLYEGGVRSVAFVNWPGKVKPAVTDEVVHIVDWRPTLLNLVGGESDGEKPVDGKNVWPVIVEGGASPHEDILINAELHRGAVRQGKWKLISRASLPTSVELYDLEADPGEQNNLARQHPDIAQKLAVRLNDYAKGATAALYFTEYMPFIKQDYKTSSLEYDGDEDSGQPGEKPVLPQQK